MTFVLSTFAGVIATVEGDTSSNIAKMIEELTQPDGTEVPKISIEETPVSTSVRWEGPFILKICHLPLLELVNLNMS